jgi:hypothetical protein
VFRTQEGFDASPSFDENVVLNLLLALMLCHIKSLFF